MSQSALNMETHYTSETEISYFTKAIFTSHVWLHGIKYLRKVIARKN